MSETAFDWCSQRFDTRNKRKMHNACNTDLAADLMGLKRPPRVPRSQAQDTLPLMLLSFMSESRRLNNDRLKKELKVRLLYPTIAQGLKLKTAKSLKT